MMNRKLASGFAGWLSRAGGNAAMSKGLRHMLNRELSRGWRCFVAYYASVLAKRESMRKSLGHLLNRELSRGWTAWRDMIAERAEFLQKLRKGLRHMMNRKLASGLAGWRDAIAPKDDLTSKSLLHLLNRQLSRGFVGWRAILAIFHRPTRCPWPRPRTHAPSWLVSWLARMVRDDRGTCSVHAEAAQSA